jgi:hypothetical protein
MGLMHLPDLSELTIAALEDVVRAASEAEREARAALAAAVNELDRREAWRADGARQMADWLAEVTQSRASTARQVVRTSRRLAHLPLVHKTLAAGQLSWDQVVPLTRFAGEDEAWWASRAQSLSPEQLASLAARRAGDEDPDAPKVGSLKWTAADDGALKFWGRFYGEDRDRFRATVERTIERDCAPAPGDPREPYDKRAADALALLCGDHLSGLPRLDRANVNIHVRYRAEDGFSTAVLGDDVAVSFRVFERHCCDGRIRIIFEDADGCPRAWTEARSPAWPLEQAVRRRDVHCRWPGCRRRGGQVHHIVWASRHGPTTYDNLTLLCWYHHRSVHEGGWQLIGPTHDLTIRRPDGTLLAHGLAPPPPTLA